MLIGIGVGIIIYISIRNRKYPNCLVIDNCNFKKINKLLINNDLVIDKEKNK